MWTAAGAPDAAGRGGSANASPKAAASARTAARRARATAGDAFSMKRSLSKQYAKPTYASGKARPSHPRGRNAGSPRRVRDWPNPAFTGTLEQACAAAPAYPDVPRIALEVVDAENGKRAVLAAAYDTGLPPWSDDLVRCS